MHDRASNKGLTLDNLPRKLGESSLLPGVAVANGGISIFDGLNFRFVSEVAGKIKKRWKNNYGKRKIYSMCRNSESQNVMLCYDRSMLRP